MPTPIPAGEKSAFIAIVQTMNPQEALRLQTILNNYEDVATAIGRQQEAFSNNNRYLTAALDTLNNNNLELVGVYYNRTLNMHPSPPVSLWVNSNTNAGINITASPPGIGILGSSSINNIKLSPTVIIPFMFVGPGSTVDVIDGTATGSAINRLRLAFGRSTPSIVNAAKYGTFIGELTVETGSYFGGYQDDDPDAICNIPVTGMSATEITKNGVLVSWVPPVSSSPPVVAIDVFYKKTNSMAWIPVDETTGDYVDYTGFAFRYLESDTWYDIEVVVTCGNGGRAANSITIQTTCCGAGTQMTIYKFCQLTFLISSVSDSPPLGQTLCNGVSIALHYPPGTTITVPYLATVNAAPVTDMTIDNFPVQLMPYNPSTGTWDASATSVLGFNEGSVVTIGMSLPA